MTSNRMKLGVVSRIGEFPEREWKEEFEVFGKECAGVNHIELIVNYPYLGPSDYTEEDIKLLRKYAEDNKIDLILHLLPNQKGLSKSLSENMFSSKEDTEKFLEHEAKLQSLSFNIGSLNKKVREESINEIIKTLTMARELDAKLITIHGGVYINKKDYQKHLKASRKSLEQLNLYFKDEEIKLCVENLPTVGHVNNIIKEYPKTIEDLLYLVNGLNSVGICLDVGHANVSGNVIDFYQKVISKGKLFDMHLCDNMGDKDDHLPIGRGNVPFKELFGLLKKDNYNNYCSIELDTWCRNKMEKKERIIGLEYLRKFIE